MLWRLFFIINLRAELQRSVSSLQNQKCITAVSLSMTEIVSKAALHISAVVYLLCSSEEEKKFLLIYLSKKRTKQYGSIHVCPVPKMDRKILT
jgi:hypothetical protein